MVFGVKACTLGVWGVWGGGWGLCQGCWGGVKKGVVVVVSWPITLLKIEEQKNSGKGGRGRILFLSFPHSRKHYEREGG